MPALLMHLQAARHLQREGALPDPLSEAVVAQQWAYRLGAILVDLPLFERFYEKVGRFLLGVPYPESLWGSAIHSHGSVSIGAGLLARANGERRDALLAVTAGLMTHVAFDRAMHPPVEQAVDEHLRPDETHAQLHEALENYQCMVWHRRQEGSDGLGTPLLRELVAVGPGRGRRMPSWLADTVAEVLGEVYGLRPSRREVLGWARGVTAYARLLSSTLGRVSIRSSEALARRRPWVAEVELESAWERGMTGARRALVATAESLDRPSRLVELLGDGPLV